MKDRVFLFACLLALAGLILTYSNHFNNPFHFDDAHTIQTNSAIRSIKNIPSFFSDGTSFSSLPANQAYRPGLTTLNAIDFWLGGQDQPVAFQYHLSIFIVFILLGIALFFFFNHVYSFASDDPNTKWVALFSTVFFCYHCANAETINYIIQRAESFSTFMIVIGFLSYVYLPQLRRFQLFLLPMIIGFSVKEPTLMFVPLLFVYIFLFEKQTALTQIISYQGFKKVFSALLLVLPALALGGLLFAYSQHKTSELFTPGGTHVSIYLQTQTFVIVHYFNNFFLPFNLSADTDWRPIENSFDDRILIGTLFIVFMLILAFRTSRYKELRPVSFGILWFFIALLPTSSFFPFAEVLNDHRPFFPYIGLVMAVVWGLWYGLQKGNVLYNSFRKFAFAGFCLAFLFAHAYGAHHRNQVWSSAESLWKDVTLKSPGNGRGWMNYGNTQMAKANFTEALTAFNKAKELWPYYPYVHINLGVLFAATGKPLEAENYFRTAINLDNKNPESYRYYGKWLMDQQRFAEAKNILNQGLEVSPKHAELQLYYAQVQQYNDGKNVRLENILEELKKNPTAEAYLNLSLEYYNMGDYEKCIEASRSALKIKPDYALAYNNICSAYNALKQYDKAMEACQNAIRIMPDFQLAKNNLKLAVDELNKQKNR